MVFYLNVRHLIEPVVAEEHENDLGDVGKLPDVPDAIDKVEAEQRVRQRIESRHLLSRLEGDVEVGLAEPVRPVERRRLAAAV